MRNEFASVNKVSDFVTCAGDPVHVEFSPVIMDDGTLVLKESGKTNVQEFIDSFRESTDMSYIIRKLREGDESVLHQRESMFGDFTDMPKTYAEVLQLVMDKEKQFMELPLDVRKSFDNDFKKWFATSGTEEWMKFMDPVILKDKDVVEEEKSDES